MSTELIIFDLGRVLVDFNFRKVIHNLKPYTRKSEKEILQFFERTSLWDVFERGQISPEAFFRGLQKGLGLKRLSFDQFGPLWNDIFWEKPDTLAIVRRLRGRYRLAVLSNANAMHWEHVRQRHTFMRWFDYSIASFTVGLRKPEPEIYRLILRRAGVPPQRALFIDDLAVHVRAAQSLGLRAHQFHTAAHLLTQLDGILT